MSRHVPPRSGGRRCERHSEAGPEGTQAPQVYWRCLLRPEPSRGARSAASAGACSNDRTCAGFRENKHGAQFPLGLPVDKELIPA